MDGLPSDFAQSSALAAIASLIDDDDDCKDDNHKKSASHFHLSTAGEELKSGGGKIKMTGNKRNNRHSPYNKDMGATIKGEKKATLGEAQLFLGMWKI